jgi:polyphenol oxidase
MKERFINSLRLLQFENLSRHNTISHYISGREGGVSQHNLGGLNLSFKVGDERERVVENRKRLAEAMNVDARNLIFPSQTHSINVKVVNTYTDPSDLEDTDALISNAKGILISVMSADCVPILLHDQKNQAVAAIHAGWRGTVGKILETTIKAMQENFGTEPQDLEAGIGPSICMQVYEVGDEVINEVIKAFGNNDALFKRMNGTGKGYINLWEMNKLQLIKAGVKENSIETAGICTYTESEKFFSARKSGNKAGRFAAGIMIK